MRSIQFAPAHYGTVNRISLEMTTARNGEYIPEREAGALLGRMADRTAVGPLAARKLGDTRTPSLSVVSQPLYSNNPLQTRAVDIVCIYTGRTSRQFFGFRHLFLCIHCKKLALFSTRLNGSRALPRTPVRPIEAPVRWIAVAT